MCVCVCVCAGGRTAEADDPRALMILLEAGAEMNARTPRNWTALHIAVKSHNVNIVAWLLGQPCVKRAVRIHDGAFTPREMAKEEALDDIVRMHLRLGVALGNLFE